MSALGNDRINKHKITSKYSQSVSEWSLTSHSMYNRQFLNNVNCIVTLELVKLTCMWCLCYSTVHCRCNVTV